MLDNKSRKLLSIVLTAVLLVQCGTWTTKAEAASDLQTITVYSAGENPGTDDARTMMYHDAYFTKSSFEYDPSLATASMCLAMSAFGSSTIFQGNTTDYTKSPVNFIGLMKELGCTNTEVDTNPKKTTTIVVSRIRSTWPLALPARPSWIARVPLRC